MTKKEKCAIVTGGSSGIGLAICNELLTQSYFVYNLDLRPNGEAQWIDCDVTNTAKVDAAIAKVLSRFKSIDVLVCNAGKHLSANIEDTQEDDFDSLLNLNVKGAYLVTKACLPVMRQAQYGRILFVASEQALVAKPNSFAYNLSKHALASMAKTTALDYAAFGITANAICPGTVDTPLYQQAIDKYCKNSGRDPDEVHQEEAKLQPVGRIANAEEVAQFAAFLISEEAGFITGSLQVIDGGYSAR